jgi:hypothetical protein
MVSDLEKDKALRTNELWIVSGGYTNVPCDWFAFRLFQGIDVWREDE